MTRYLLHRAGQALLVVLLVTAVVFVLLHLLPGGPARAQLGTRATPQAVAAFNHRTGLDRPLPVQYWDWLARLLSGDLGFSTTYNQPVTSLLAQRLPKTLVLTGLSTVLAAALAVPVGTLQAVRRNRPTDHVITIGAFACYATPPFFLGVVLIVVFAVHLPVLPPQAPQGGTLGAVLSRPAGLVLPVLTLTLVTLAQFSRYVRSSVIANLAEDHVRTARAKGAGQWRVLHRHVLPNSLVPVVTLLGLSLPAIVSGALVTEAVFNVGGTGQLFWIAAQNQDYPVMLGTTVLAGLATVVGSLLADLACAALDPRVRCA